MQVYEMFHIQSKYKCIMVMWSASGSPPKKYLAVLDIACLGGVGWSKRLPGWFGALIKRVHNYSSSNGYLACFERVVKACQYDLWHFKLHNMYN